MITKILIHAHYEQSFRTYIQSNFSDYICYGNFYKLGDDKLLYTIALFFNNLNPAKYNYKMYD